jgi:TonB family protein
MVVVHLRVDRTGAVDSVVVGRGFSEGDSTLRAAFDSAAVLAAWQWRFQPATANGKPVRTWIAVPFRFDPPGSCKETQHQPFPADDKRPIVDRAPEPLRMVPPEYPATTGKDRVDGLVLVHALICEHGGVVKAIVVTSEAPILNEPAATAMLKCTYRPALMKGRPVATWIDVPFRFTLR